MVTGKLYGVFTLLVSLCLSIGSICAGECVQFHVSCDKGNDSNPGTLESPLRTIQEAQTRVRASIAGGMESDATVTIHAGKYYVDRPLTFDHRDSGRDGYEVIYKGVPGCKAEIIGGRPVFNWSRVDEHIYKAYVGKNRKFNTLFENGEWSVPAGTPDKGYLRAEGGSNDAGGATLTFKDGDLPKDADYGKAYVSVWAGAHEGGHCYDWYESLSPIKSIDWQSRTITLEKKTYWNVSANNRYTLSNVRELLNHPGEFFLDSAEGMLYYWPRKLPIERQEIIAPRTVRVLDITGASTSGKVENLVFDTLKISYSDSTTYFCPNNPGIDNGMVVLDKAKNITIRNCHIRNAGTHALTFNLSNQDHTISGCLIEGAGSCGIYVSGPGVGDPTYANEIEANVSKRFKISNNYIRSCGKRVGHGSAIWLSQSGEYDISHNVMEDMPRYGVRIAGACYVYMVVPSDYRGRGQGGEIYGKKVTWENHLDFIYMRNINLTDNEIRDVMTDSQDGGAVYVWGGADGLFANNMIYAMRPFDHRAAISGIYLDDGARHFTVKNNVITDMHGTIGDYYGALPLFIKGTDNVVTGNVVALNDSSSAFYSTEAGLAGLPDSVPGIKNEIVKDLTFERNIIYSNKGKRVFTFSPWRPDMIKSSDSNLVYPDDGSAFVLLEWVPNPWKEWLAMGYDKNSVHVDPMFVDPKRFDFRLKKDSPALEMGFEGVDTSTIGVKPDFPFMSELRKADARYGRVRPVK